MVHRLALNPLFYDALSGEFTPSTDINHQHTLGRLAVATYEKGVDVSGNNPAYSHDGEGDIDGFMDIRQYTPSWAREVLSIVECHSSQYAFLKRLTLRYCGSDSPNDC